MAVLAASYSCFTPFVVAVAVAVFWFVLYEIEVVHNHEILSAQKFGDILEIPFFILIGNLILGFASLFGIPRHGLKPILLKAVIGILASLGVGFAIFVLIAMSSITC